mgnify:FL=1
MIRKGLISNARSEQNKRGMSELEAVFENDASVLHRPLESMDGLPGAIRDLADWNADVIVVNGGDGTVQAVLTELLEARPFTTLPPVALLRRGNTNMTAADCGMIGKAAPALERLTQLSEPAELTRRLVPRPVLRLENALGYRPQRGMFFGAAGIVNAIEICREKVHARGFQSEWANGLTLGGLLLTWLLRGERGPLQGENLGITLDDAAPWRKSQLLVLCTTLERLVLNSRPFWNQDEGAMHFTSIAFPPRRILRDARRILYGGNDRKLSGDLYRSQSANKVMLEDCGAFTLDGQIFEPEPGRPVMLSAEETVEFVRF